MKRLTEGTTIVKDWFKLTTYMATGFIGFGFLFVFLAWNGAAEVDTIQQQFPYLISGGLTGIALIILGVSILVVQDGRRRAAEADQRLDELQALLQRLVESTGVSAQLASMDGAVVAGAASYHDPGCHLVEGRDEAEYISVDEAQDRGLKACRICNPPA